MGEMHELKRSEGDLKVIWDSEKPDEVESARAQFDRLIAKGYQAFSVKGKDGAKGELIRQFDPDAERIILAPRMAGGV